MKALLVRGTPEAVLEQPAMSDVAVASRLTGLGPYVFYDGPADASSGRFLRTVLQHLSPVPLELRPSFGFGDRLGLATPGHVASLERADTAAGIAPVFAQQSVRENSRTGRTPAEVLEDATFGVLQTGCAGALGADADHVKTTEDIELFAQAG